MTKVTIVAEDPGSPNTAFRASARERESVGRTPGAALDALTEQLGGSEIGTLVVVQNLRPDQFFTAAQQQRLDELLTLWHAARDSGAMLPAGAQAELEALVDAELDGATGRAAAIVRELRA
jgi:hypothetical protein